MMKRDDLTQTEQETMRAIWELYENGETATTSSIRKKISKWRGEKIYGQTVYSYVTKLEESGFVKVERSENGRIIVVPLIEKEDYMKQQAKLWAGFWNRRGAKCALMMLSGTDDNPTEEEKEELRRFLDELD